MYLIEPPVQAISQCQPGYVIDENREQETRQEYDDSAENERIKNLEKIPRIFEMHERAGNLGEDEEGDS